MIRLSLGNVGCLAGDTEINVYRGIYNFYQEKMTIEEMFKNKNDTLKITHVSSYNGDILIRNKIKDVVYSGRKLCLVLETHTGKTLVATPEHEIMTDKGYIMLDDIRPHHFVITDSMNKFEKVESINILGEFDTYDIICEDPYRNFVANGIVVHNSGKTAAEVRNLYLNPSGRKTLSNIQTKHLKNNIKIKPEMIIRREHVGDKKKKDGSIEPQYKLELNKEYWQNIKEPINVMIDEAHTLLNPRRAMSKVNVIMTDWLALIRRVLGSNDAGEGEAVFITQLPRRLDPITRDMASEIRHHICHYKKQCHSCKSVWVENSDMPERKWSCPVCGGLVKKYNHVIEVLKFQRMDHYYAFIEAQQKTFFDRYFITDIERYFRYYDTMQWDDMFSEFY